jgi:hypothetical protein
MPPTIEEEGAESETLREALARTIRFQRFLTRRAWGVFYAFWAALVAWNLGVSAVALVWFHARGLVAYVAWSAAVIAGVLLFLLSARWIFREAARMGQLRRLLPTEFPFVRYRRISWFGVVLVLVMIFVGEAIIGALAELALFGGSLVLVILASRRQIESVGRMYPEGRWALGAHAAAAIVSIALLFASYRGYIPWLWVPVAAVGIGAAVYALYYAPDELAGESE